MNVSRPVVSNCLFIDNSASRDGGAIYNRSDPLITNCTFSGNTAGGQGGGIFNRRPDQGCPILTNCILWDNSDSNDIEEFSQIHGGVPVINYSCIQGWSGILGGIGNIGDDPGFVDLPDGNYHLEWHSPCIDAGDPGSDCSKEPWPNGFRINMGAYGNTSEATRSPVDFEHLATFAAYWLTDEPLVDIAPEPDGDGIANFLDFAALADIWRSGQ
jgi:hypothetical protein